MSENEVIICINMNIKNESIYHKNENDKQNARKRELSR